MPLPDHCHTFLFMNFLAFLIRYSRGPFIYDLFFMAQDLSETFVIFFEAC